jgi:hypothetical protein
MNKPLFFYKFRSEKNFRAFDALMAWEETRYLLEKQFGMHEEAKGGKKNSQ